MGCDLYRESRGDSLKMAASNINKHAANADNKLQDSSQCNFCVRKGLPIIPVRYAVCERGDWSKNILELDAARVKEFTDITLDQTIEDGSRVKREVKTVELSDGSKETVDNTLNKYILRQLREGYLYIYDKKGSKWLSYLVTRDSKFYGFNAKEPILPNSTESKFPEHCNNNVHNPIKASYISLENPEDYGVIYYAFSDTPWPVEHLEMIESTATDSWLDKNMQKVDISAWINQKDKHQDFAYETWELNKVAEFGDGQYFTKNNFHYRNINHTLYPATEVYKTIDNPDSSLRGLVLAVNDEMGIIEELNAYRHEAIAPLGKYIGSSNSKDPIYEKRRRLLNCKKAVDAFQKSFEEGYRAKITKEHNNNAFGRERDNRIAAENRSWKSTKALLESFIEDAKKENDPEKIKDSEEVYKRAEQQHIDTINALNDNFNHDIDRVVENTSDKHVEQLDSLYDKEALEQIDNEYQDLAKKCQAFLSVQDDDYSLWVINGLPKLIERYSEKHLWTGLGVSGLIANALRGGILSPSSAYVWKTYAQGIDSDKSIILKAIFSNNADLVKNACSHISSLKENEQLSSEFITNWQKNNYKLRENATGYTGDVLKEYDIINVSNPIYGTLTATIGTALSTLVSYEGAGVIKADMQAPMRHFLQYEVLAYSADPDVMSGKTTMPRLVNIKIKLSELYQWLELVHNKKQSDTVDKDKSFKVSDGTSGNFVAPPQTSTTTINFLLPTYGLSDKEINEIRELFNESDSSEKGASPEKIKERWDTLKENAQSISQKIASGFDKVNPNSGKSVGWGRAIGFGLTVWSLASLYKKGFKVDDSDKVSVAKILGFTVSTGSTITAAVDSSETIWQLSKGISVSNIVHSKFWSIADKCFNVAAGVLSIWDGFSKYSDALHAQSQGRRLGAENLIIMGSVAIAGGIATIATAIFISSGIGFILGILLGLVTLVLGYFFITLVKPSVETWIDRSFIGRHEGQIEKFKNVEEEQNSLEMVMAGVIVDFSTSWVDKEDFGYYNYQGTAPQFFFYSDEDEKEYFKYANGRNVAIKIKVPKNKNINLSLKLQSINSESIFLYSNYSNYNSQDVLKEIDTHRAQLAAKSSGDNSLFGEDFKLIKDCYILNFKKNFSKKELSNGIRLSLSMEINKLFPSRLNDYFELDF